MSNTSDDEDAKDTAQAAALRTGARKLLDWQIEAILRAKARGVPVESRSAQVITEQFKLTPK